MKADAACGGMIVKYLYTETAYPLVAVNQGYNKKVGKAIGSDTIELIPEVVK